MADVGRCNLAWADRLLANLAASGVRHVVLSPGSRCTPLTVAAVRHPLLTCRTHFDERGAGFYALGLALATQRPVLLISTSGSAAANYAPAVAEAFQSGVPLLILTADRPPELHDCGANQTMPQDELFGGHLVDRLRLPCPDEAEPEQAADFARQAVCRARQALGPVHLNCPFREPLLPAGDLLDPQPEPTAAEREAPPLPDLAELIEDLTDPVVVVGQLRSTQEQQAVLALLRHTGWPWHAEVTAGLGIQLGSRIVFDPESEPSQVLQLGARLLDKGLLAQLAQQPRTVVTSQARTLDATQTAHRQVHAPLDLFCIALRQLLPANPTAHVEGETCLPPAARLNEETAVATTISALAPECALILGNSMPVRLANFCTLPHHIVPVYTNRGVSGIDGTVATAAGIAAGRQQPAICLLGDLALLHDLNSLSLLGSNPAAVIIVVLNNNGGRIFERLPIGERQPLCEQWFVTPHGFDFKHAAQQFGLAYASPTSCRELRTCITNALEGTPRPILVEPRLG